MIVLALFDGISCGQVAFQRANIEVDQYFASEVNSDSIAVTQYHFPKTIQLGDITKLTDEKLRELPKIDIVMGGSPCQDLSAAKQNRQYLKGDKSSLFYEFVRILNWLKEFNNKHIYFLLENVKTQQETLDEMSREVGTEPIMINSVLVSAQRRERNYWTNIPGVTHPEDKGLKIRDVVYDNAYKIFSSERIEETKSLKRNYVQWDMSGKGHLSQQDRAYYMDGTMCTLTKGNPGNKLNIWLGEDQYRRCHPIEAERFQTLPDNYTSIIESDSKRIGLVGDGWTVDVIAHILSFLPIDKPVEKVENKQENRLSDIATNYLKMFYYASKAS